MSLQSITFVPTSQTTQNVSFNISLPWSGGSASVTGYTVTGTFPYSYYLNATTYCPGGDNYGVQWYTVSSESPSASWPSSGWGGDIDLTLAKTCNPNGTGGCDCANVYTAPVTLFTPGDASFTPNYNGNATVSLNMVATYTNSSYNQLLQSGTEMAQFEQAVQQMPWNGTITINNSQYSFTKGRSLFSAIRSLS
jgi:hypothetical protein